MSMMKKLLCISLPVAVLDQLVKTWVRAQPLGAALCTLPGVLEIVPSRNTGAAFSLLSGHTAALAVFSAVLLVLLCTYVRRVLHLTRAADMALYVLIGGGVGNLLDRAFYGGVTDYIRLLLFNFPIFNLADVAITASVAVLIGLLLTGKLEKYRGEGHG